MPSRRWRSPGRSQRWSAAGLPAEFVRLEVLSIVTNLDDQFGPLGRHDAEQAIAVERSERLEPGQDATRPRARDLRTRSCGQLDLADKSDGAQADNRDGRDADRRSPQPWFGPGPIGVGLRDWRSPERPVVEQREVENDREKVEEAVV